MGSDDLFDDEYFRVREDALEEGYDVGYANGRDDGISEAAENPSELFRALAPWQWKTFVQAINAEAARLGVRV